MSTVRTASRDSATGRRGFLAAAAGVAALGTLGRGAVADTWARGAHPETDRAHIVSHALVLSGGGAHGAYEAGLIAKSARLQGVADGAPLTPYGLICGTSVGAINAWFAATGQYTALEAAWKTIASQNVIRLKPMYYALTRPHRFIGERLRAAIRLATRLTKNERGIAESRPVLEWMRRNMNPQAPVLTPVIWAVTNLTTQSAEYFYRLPPALRGPMPERLVAALHATLGHDAVLREASDDELLQTLLASAAFPLVFDPVPLASPDGTQQLYADGGIASNSSIAIARTVAENVHVVLLDPPVITTTYASGIDIVLGAYGTMQRKILEVEMRDVYFQSLSRRALQRVAPGAAGEMRRDSALLTALVHDLPITKLAYRRPDRPLAADAASFDRQDLIDATFAQGEADAQRGFTPYDWEAFRA